MSLRLGNLAGMLAIGIALASLPAGATSVTTTSYQTWKTSDITGAPSELTFPGGSCSTCNSAAGLVIGGFNFTGPNGLGGFYMTQPSSGPTGLMDSTNSGASINVATPTPGENAFLLSLGTTGGTPITITLSDNETFNVSAGLFGIALSQDVTSFSISTTSGSQVYVNDFFYGVSSLPQDGGGTGGSGNPPTGDTPECATVALLAGGALVLFGSRKRLVSGLPV